VHRSYHKKEHPAENTATGTALEIIPPQRFGYEGFIERFPNLPLLNMEIIQLV
jgi:hypothetical protein